MSDERLGSTLFLAALVHGVVILGVTFTATPLNDEVAAPSLNVTLVLDTEREELAADTASFSPIAINWAPARRLAACGRRARCPRISP